MAEGKGRNDGDPDAILGAISSLNMNPESSRALEMLTADDVMAMQFDSLAAAESFYLKYASALGFVVRKDDKVGNKQGVVSMRRWVCDREASIQRTRLFDDQDDPMPSTRFDCPASFCVSADLDSDKWLVREFGEDHTHDLESECGSPHQIDQPVVKPEDVKKKGSIGVKEQPIQAVDNLPKQVDCDQVGVGKQDSPASSDAHYRAYITPDEAKTALAFIKGRENQDPWLFHETKYVEGQLAYTFYADAKSQVDCACFGDVMAVFRTKWIDLPFVILAGLNHHHQTTVFGCAILHDETVEAYSWLFQTYLQGMQGCMPMSVVTDGHQALCQAIKHVFPRSRHRLCTWHLEKIASSKVNNPSFESDFKVLMLQVLSPHDFELKWKAMVHKYKLSENAWVHKMYKKRHEWAETYLRGHFWAGLQSTKVCEIFDKNLGRFSLQKRKLNEFLKMYDDIVVKLRWNEAKAEHESKNVRFALSTLLVKIEKHAADVFTRKSYQRFLSEMRLETLLFVLEKDDGSDCRKYKLGKYEHPNLTCEVSFKPSGPSIECSCLKFETWGIPCNHAIHVMKCEGLGEIPQNLIHPRWTKEAKSSAQFWQRYSPPVSSFEVERMKHYGYGLSAGSILVYLGSESIMEFDVAKCRIEKAATNHAS